ncbi:hypothetical protein PR003_g27281 [Phytophthora rubi]|uniref:Uncharacterized protein n=1 Tax=Phytophthora rubi TaxID=129364 RepID=A0A6A3HZR5_9STRA|nr:hypothetical protein PR002_g26758 [Phytophthora rubi]KAE8974265.1 hypothetical protein PR001_g26042 [Phytophthora rubi]KAE9282898.1 hypothetical protein PR003_g27281 [Phytophthora rubi]
MQTAPSKRFFPQFQTKKRSADVASDVEELSLVELLEVEDDPAPLQAQTASGKRSVPGAQAYVNRLLVRVRQVAQEKQTRLTSGLTSHSFRRGAAMHDNDGSVAENWIIERGGWQLDRVNKAFGYMLGSTQADRNVSRVLSGWSPKKGARLPSLHALEQPIRDRATKFQALIFTNSMAFADTTLNLDEDVAECLVATLLMHYPDLLLLAETSALVTRMRETMAARAIGEAEVLAWSAAIRIAFDPPEKTPPPEETSEIAAVLDVVKRQSKQIEVQILQNKRLEERLLAIETHLRMKMVDQAPITRPDADQQAAAPTPQQDSRAIRPKKKGSQSLSSVWFEWFTSEPRVYASRSVKNSTLHEFRHAVGYMLLFLPIGFALDGASDAFKSEVLSAGVKAQDNTLAFLKANGSSALAVGTVIKALRKLHKEGKLDEHIAQFHERSNAGSIVDPTPASALPAFIRLQPKQ